MIIFETEKQLREFLIYNGCSHYLVKYIWNKLKFHQISDNDIVVRWSRIDGCTKSI